VNGAKLNYSLAELIILITYYSDICTSQAKQITRLVLSDVHEYTIQIKLQFSFLNSREKQLSKVFIYKKNVDGWLV
jgi:hypothetical protein